MKIRYSVALALVVACAASAANAQSTLYWSGNGTTQGGTGTWDTTLTRWGTVPAGPYSTVWNNSNVDTAFFGGTSLGAAGTVTLGAPVTPGGVTFNIAGYTIQSDTLTFGGTNNTVTLNNSVANAAINSAVTGTANMTFTAQNPLANNTLTFGGASAAGWSGTTTVNAGMTLALVSTASTTNNALQSTTGSITINGGTISLNRKGVTGNPALSRRV